MTREERKAVKKTNQTNMTPCCIPFPWSILHWRSDLYSCWLSNWMKLKPDKRVFVFQLWSCQVQKDKKQTGHIYQSMGSSLHVVTLCVSPSRMGLFFPIKCLVSTAVLGLEFFANLLMVSDRFSFMGKAGDCLGDGFGDVVNADWNPTDSASTESKGSKVMLNKSS